MFSIYKPTSKNTGGAASFKANNDGVFVEVLKQKTWNDNTKKGTFDPEAKMVVFLNLIELSTILRVLNGKLDEFKIPHVQKDKTQTNISFTKWKNNETLMGFGFSVHRGDKRNSVSFNLNEAELLKQFIAWAIQKGFEYNQAENLKNIKAGNKTPVLEVEGDLENV